jgi:hypothetical protein
MARAAPKQQKRNRVQAQDYTWKELNGLIEILRSTKDQVYASVDVVGEPSESWWGRYGTRLQDVREAVQFDNGTIFLLATTATWGGTFASHDEIATNYYELTPKKR